MPSWCLVVANFNNNLYFFRLAPSFEVSSLFTAFPNQVWWSFSCCGVMHFWWYLRQSLCCCFCFLIWVRIHCISWVFILVFVFCSCFLLFISIRFFLKICGFVVWWAFFGFLFISLFFNLHQRNFFLVVYVPCFRTGRLLNITDSQPQFSCGAWFLSKWKSKKSARLYSIVFVAINFGLKKSMIFFNQSFTSLSWSCPTVACSAFCQIPQLVDPINVFPVLMRLFLSFSVVLSHKCRGLSCEQN